MEELKKTVDNLVKVSGGLKQEVLDIKERLADSNIDNVDNIILSNFESIKRELNLQLSKYTTGDDVASQYYNKNYIDTVLNSISSKLLTQNVIESYINNNCVTKSGLKGYVTLNSLDSYLNSTLSDYTNNKDLSKTYATIDYVNSTIDENNVDYSKFVDKDFLTSNYYNKTEVENLIPSVSSFIKKSELWSLISLDKYALSEWVDNTFVRKSEFSLDGCVTEYDLNKKLDTLNDTFKNYTDSQIKKSTQIYATKEYVDTKCLDVHNAFIYDFIPNFEIELKSNLASKEDLESYVTNSYLKKCLGELLENDKEEISLDEYAKLTDIKDFAKSSEVDNFKTKISEYDKNILSIKDSIKSLNSSLKGYMTIDSFIKGDFITISQLPEQLLRSDVATKSDIEESIKKLNIDSLKVDTSEFLTLESLDEMKSYVDNKLNNYVTLRDVYTRSYIEKYFYKKEDIDNNFYDKIQLEKKFVNVSTLEDYVTYNDAYSKFLLKEDYRGIKDAMTLNSFYKNTPEVFNKLIENSKMTDGFYIVGDSIKVVKDNKVYDTLLTGSDSVTENELDEKLKSIKPKNWRRNE